MHFTSPNTNAEHGASAGCCVGVNVPAPRDAASDDLRLPGEVGVTMTVALGLGVGATVVVVGGRQDDLSSVLPRPAFSGERADRYSKSGSVRS